MGLETIAIFAVAPVLLWAGLEKIRDIRPIAGTVRGLGIPQRLSLPVAALIAGTEILLALSVIFTPTHTLTHAGIVILAAAFAAAGLIAVVSGKSISCNCLGVSGSGRLGKPQLLALPVWIAASALLRYGGTEAPSLETASAYFAGIALAITLIQGVRVIRSQVEARRDRLSALEMYIWLQRS